MVKDIISKSVFRKAIWRLEDNILQWFWYIFSIKPQRIGYDKGLLTWLREKRHRNLRRKVHICFLEYPPEDGKFGRFTVFWINERSRICSASLNERIEDADIVWIYSQDPIPDHVRNQLSEALKRINPGVPIINHPEIYNAYHNENTFKMLAEAGVHVPRSEFNDEDIGKVMVVYKAKGQQGASKSLSLYNESRNGFKTFEFVDSRRSDGQYGRYRAHYIVGIVRPSKAMFSNHWNVCIRNMNRLEYTFTMTPLEIEQVKLIAKTLCLQYFAVDYLRRSGDDLPVFTDINVYPLVVSLTETGRKLRYYGRWHTFDTRWRLGLIEPEGRPFWEMFDDAMLNLV